MEPRPERPEYFSRKWRQKIVREYWSEWRACPTPMESDHDGTQIARCSRRSLIELECGHIVARMHNPRAKVTASCMQCYKEANIGVYGRKWIDHCADVEKGGDINHDLSPLYLINKDNK